MESKHETPLAPPVYLAIEGVIGVGKTTLARLLQAEYQADLTLEVFEENPFLAPFYSDPERYAFQVQIVFLLSRYRQQRSLRERAGRVPLVSDYLFAKDRLFANMNLSGDEWETYDHLHTALAERIAVPDLVVYLRADLDTLMARITQRDRPYERSMPREYIARLSDQYEAYFHSYEASPLLVIDTDDLNLLTNPEDIAQVRERVRAAVGLGTYQQTLPLNGDSERPFPTRAPVAEPVERARPESVGRADPLLAYLRLQEEMGVLATALRQRDGAEQGHLRRVLQATLRSLHELAADLDVELGAPSERVPDRTTGPL